MKRFVLIFVFLVMGSLMLDAQPTMPDKCQVFYPDILLSSVVLRDTDAIALENSSDFGQSKAPRNKTFWVVYSDRDDNVTYDAPGNGKKYSSLALNDRLRIAQLKNGYALVYSEPQADIAYPMISQFAECKGWIPMKNLLLWHSCPADDADIYQKALLCVNLDETAGSETGKLYRNPKNKSKCDVLTTNMEFYFVMKREDNLALLARNHTLDGRSDNVLLGWVATQSYVEWNQRSCLEPTWDKRDVEYFADEGVVIDIYDMSKDKCVTQIPFKRKEVTGNDPHMYRMRNDQLRFPILDGSTAEQYNCSTFGTAGGAPTVVSGDEDDKQSPLGYSEEKLQQMTNINIGIVIDGTSSMEPFYPAVKEAIKEGAKFFSDKFSVKVGIVIYRDYKDGEFVTEKFPLTRPENPNLSKWLDTGGKYGIKSNSGDRTLEEAMYEGINVALDQLGFNPDQSNLLLVVGDCGNDREDTKYTANEIINKLVDKNVHMMGFQVRKGEEDAFKLFNNQLQEILYKSLKKKYSNLNWTGQLQMKNTADGWMLVNDVKSNLFIGSHSMPQSGQQQIQLGKLSKLMQESIMYCSESVSTQINLVSSWQNKGFNRSDIDSGIDLNEEYLKWKLGEERYEEYKKSNSLMTFKGYSNRNHRSGRMFFKPVVFISSDELNTLIERLAPVNSATVMQNNDRRPYVNAMKALVQSMDPSITDERINQYGVNEIMKMIAGLNEAAGALKGDYTIAEIADPQAVSNVEYLSLVQAFSRKYKGLQRLKAMQYKYTYTINGLKYYWLPVEDLP